MLLPRRDYSMGDAAQLAETEGLATTILPVLIPAVIGWFRQLRYEEQISDSVRLLLADDEIRTVLLLLSYRVTLSIQQLWLIQPELEPDEMMQQSLADVQSWLKGDASEMSTSAAESTEAVFDRLTAEQLQSIINGWWYVSSLRSWHELGGAAVLERSDSSMSISVPFLEQLFGMLYVLRNEQNSDAFVDALYKLFAQPDTNQPDRPLYEAIVDSHFKEFAARLYYSQLAPNSDQQSELLELGCGSGLLAVLEPRFTTSFTLFGIDLVPDMLAWASQRGYETQVSSVESLPYADGRFPVVLCSFVLHYLDHEQQRKALFEAGRVLAQGGTFLFDVYHIMEPEKASITLLLQQLGFAHIAWYTEMVERSEVQQVGGARPPIVLHYCVAKKLS